LKFHRTLSNKWKIILVCAICALLVFVLNLLGPVLKASGYAARFLVQVLTVFFFILPFVVLPWFGYSVFLRPLIKIRLRARRIAQIRMDRDFRERQDEAGAEKTGSD
jgi:predicted membrane metal-binding protein